MKSINFVVLTAALAVGSTGTVVAAADQDNQPVVVRAQPIDKDLPTRRVSYADLDLATQAGEKTLYRRVSSAVTHVCRESTGPNPNGWEDMHCRTFAWGGAKPQMKQAIQRARDIAQNGFSTIAPVAIQIAVR